MMMNIPNNLALGGFYFFRYTDQAGNSGVVHFIVVECPGIAPPNPPTVDYCSSFISTILNLRSKEQDSKPEYQLEKLSIKPNPVQYNILLENIELGSEFHIIDLSGKNIKNGIINSEEIQLDDLQAGLYLIYITSKDHKKIKYGKFIKTN